MDYQSPGGYDPNNPYPPDAPQQSAYPTPGYGYGQQPGYPPTDPTVLDPWPDAPPPTGPTGPYAPPPTGSTEQYGGYPPPPPPPYQAPPSQGFYGQPPQYQAPPSQGFYGQPPMAYPPAAYYPAAPSQSGGGAIAAEVIAGLFGIWGIGWLIKGYTSIGVSLLVGGLVFGVVMLVIAFLTFGVGLLCWGPLNLVAMIISAVTLSNRLKNGPPPM